MEQGLPEAVFGRLEVGLGHKEADKRENEYFWTNEFMDVITE